MFSARQRAAVAYDRMRCGVGGAGIFTIGALGRRNKSASLAPQRGPAGQCFSIQRLDRVSPRRQR